MMNKMAIIIGSPGGYRNLSHRRSVAVDLDNYYSFLRSNAGGQWNEDEIQILRDPDSNSIKETINKVNSDYCFVAFSGHGLTNSFTEADFICLKDKDLSIKYLVSKSERQTIIIDSRREFESNLLKGDANILMEESELQIKDNSTHNIFNDTVLRTPKGIILVYSSQPNEISGDDPNLGGHFTYSLIQAGFNWWNDKSNQGILKLDSAIDSAEIILKNKFKTTQKPLMGGQVRRLTFPPFACSKNEK
ncbi:MAG: caspase family protein [Bacteroidales bacterium]|nr:caspase family protein [Bacteroidales bacterium]